MMLLILAGLACALLSLRFADQPELPDVADDGPAAPAAEDAPEIEGAPQSPDEAMRAAVEETLAERAPEAPAEPEPKSQAAPERGQQPSEPGTLPTLAQVADAYRLSPERREALGALPPQVQQQVRGILGECWERYHGASVSLLDEARQLQGEMGRAYEYFQELDRWARDPASLADYFRAAPELWTHVVQLVQGGNGADAGGTSAAPEGLRLDEFDPQTRQALEHFERRSGVLREQIEHLRGSLSTLTEREQERAQREEQRAAEMRAEAEQQAGAVLHGVADEIVGRASKEFGFNLSDYREQLAAAWSYVLKCAKAKEFSGIAPAEMPAAIERAFRDGMKVAGFPEIRARRRSQARTTVRPPATRAPGARVALNPDDQMREAIAEARAEVGAEPG